MNKLFSIIIPIYNLEVYILTASDLYGSRLIRVLRDFLLLAENRYIIIF